MAKCVDVAQTSKDVRVGLLGSARVATYALIEPARNVPGLKIDMIGSRDNQRARDYARLHDIPRWGTYDDLLADPTLDAIYIALPVSLHAEWSLRALAAGKAVLCEKPLAQNADEAARCVHEARRFDLPFIEAFHWLHHPIAEKLRSIVVNRQLGRIVSVETRFDIPKKWLKDDDFRLDYQRGGGVLLDAGYYGISLLRLMLGELVGVRQASATLVASQVDAGIDAMLEFACGALGRVVASYHATSEKMEISARIVGENGSATVINPFLPHLGCCIEFDRAGEKWTEHLDGRPSYWFQALHFTKIMQGGSGNLNSVEDAMANLAAVDMTYRAAGLLPRGQQ